MLGSSRKVARARNAVVQHLLSPEGPREGVGTGAVLKFSLVRILRCLNELFRTRGLVRPRPYTSGKVGAIASYREYWLAPCGKGGVREVASSRENETPVSSTCRRSNRPPPVLLLYHHHDLDDDLDDGDGERRVATILEARRVQATDEALSGAAASRHDGSVH